MGNQFRDCVMWYFVMGVVAGVTECEVISFMGYDHYDMVTTLWAGV